MGEDWESVPVPENLDNGAGGAGEVTGDQLPRAICHRSGDTGITLGHIF